MMNPNSLDCSTSSSITRLRPASPKVIPCLPFPCAAATITPHPLTQGSFCGCPHSALTVTPSLQPGEQLTWFFSGLPVHMNLLELLFQWWVCVHWAGKRLRFCISNRFPGNAEAAQNTCWPQGSTGTLPPSPLKTCSLQSWSAQSVLFPSLIHAYAEYAPLP